MIIGIHPCDHVICHMSHLGSTNSTKRPTRLYGCCCVRLTMNEIDEEGLQYIGEKKPTPVVANL